MYSNSSRGDIRSRDYFFCTAVIAINNVVCAHHVLVQSTERGGERTSPDNTTAVYSAAVQQKQQLLLLVSYDTWHSRAATNGSSLSSKFSTKDFSPVPLFHHANYLESNTRTSNVAETALQDYTQKQRQQRVCTPIAP